MAQFYASLEEGHATASTALKRIVGFTPKNNFYQPNLQLGRILKTEHILYWMADPHKRKRTRKKLLKVEEIHQLARDITYGNRGRLKGKTLEEITSSGNYTDSHDGSYYLLAGKRNQSNCEMAQPGRSRN